MLNLVANYIFTVGKQLFDSLLSVWGIIGLGIVFNFLLVRVVNFIKKFFK